MAFAVVNQHQPLVLAPRPMVVPILSWKPSYSVLRGSSGVKVALEGTPRHRMGGFAWGRAPESILWITGGLAGMSVGGVFPSPIDSIAKALGVAAAGYGVYYLFTDPSEKETKEDIEAKAAVEQARIAAEKARITAEQMRRTPSLAEFQAIKGTIVSPLSGQIPELNFWGNSFDIQVMWFNGADKELDLTYDVLAQSIGLGFPVEGKNLITKSVYRDTITLPLKGNTKPFTVTIPLIEPPEVGLRGVSNPTYYMQLTLRKIDSNGNAILTPASVRVGPFLY